jgi:hypothetical protein
MFAQTPLSNITNQAHPAASFPPLLDYALEFIIKIRRNAHLLRIQLSARDKFENEIDLHYAVQIKLIDNWYQANTEELAACQTHNEINRLVYRVWEEEQVIQAWVWICLVDMGSMVATEAPPTAEEIAFADWMLAGWNEVANAGEIPLGY